MRSLFALLVVLAGVAHAEDVDAGAAHPDDVDAGVGVTLAGVDFTLSAFAQADAVLSSQASVDELDPSTGQPLNELSVTLRRLRVKLSASRWIFSAAGEVEANTLAGLNLRLFSAAVSARWPSEGAPVVQLRAGLLRIPFGREVQTDALQRAFLEPATLAQALFPGAFDLGAELSGAWRFLRYQVAVMNGEPVGERALPAKDPNAAKDVMGRLGVAGAPASALRLEAGVSGLWGTGFHAGQPATKDTLAWRDANEDGLVQSTELQVVGGLPATASAGFNRFALGADLCVEVAVPTLGTLEVSGEFVWAKNLDRGLFVADPVSTGRDLRELGWSVAVTQQLPLGFAVGLRGDVYNPDADAADQQGVRRVPVDSSLTTWTAMASWRWRRTARLLAQYEHQTNALGRGLGGAPTTLGADRFTLRAEVAF